MTTTTIPTAGELRLALDDIRVRENVRDLDPVHVDNLAASIALPKLGQAPHKPRLSRCDCRR